MWSLYSGTLVSGQILVPICWHAKVGITISFKRGDELSMRASHSAINTAFIDLIDSFIGHCPIIAKLNTKESAT